MNLLKRGFITILQFLGIGAVKTGFNTSEGVTIEYVDPANLVYSYTDSPYFEDIYYVGEVKEIPVNELAKQFPHLTQVDLEEVIKNRTPQHLNNKGIIEMKQSDKQYSSSFIF